MERTIWYAVNKDGRGNIFTSEPLRNDAFGIWEGSMSSSISSIVAEFASDGLNLPNITYKDNAVILKISVVI